MIVLLGKAPTTKMHTISAKRPPTIDGCGGDVIESHLLLQCTLSFRNASPLSVEVQATFNGHEFKLLFSAPGYSLHPPPCSVTPHSGV